MPTKRISRIFDIGDLRSGHFCDLNPGYLKVKLLNIERLLGGAFKRPPPPPAGGGKSRGPAGRRLIKAWKYVLIEYLHLLLYVHS